ncbi:hypothetical protein EOK75_19475 (plasmid) [Pseudorhodobacter turbinis]|uniref:Uncharacterized protein n=1 Tax=Pseudorhodobacter turbinis TaxID=2500533 RepID=A0A4P8ELG2_9RHOB|nr:hypothetical protein [Pseudorhodobacter turbinis]QCO57839.1 hypothetical protein EOK75_19475 [Pseudorhodobacter turbinis]
MKEGFKPVEIHLTEIANFDMPKEVRERLTSDMLAGKGYEACHVIIQKQTGIWIPELEQVFKDLDKLLGLPSPKGA